MLFRSSCLVSGFFTGSATFGAGTTAEVVLTAAGGPEDTDAFVARYLANGDFAYAVRAGGPDVDEAAAAAEASGGAVRWCGFASLDATVAAIDGPDALDVAGLQDGFVIRLAPRNYKVATVLPTGFDDARRLLDSGSAANDHDRVLDVAALPDGDRIVAGWFQGDLLFSTASGGQITLSSQGGRDAFWARQNRAGQFVWARSMGAGGLEMAMSVAVDDNGSIAIAGLYEGGLRTYASSFIPSAGGTDVFVAVIDTMSGSILSLMRTGGTQDDGGIIRNVPLVSDDLDRGAVDIAYHPRGFFQGDLFLSMVSTVNRANDTTITSTVVRDNANTGTVTVVPQATPSGTGSWDVFVQPFKTTGVIVPAQQGLIAQGPGGSDQGRAIVVGPDNTVYFGATMSRFFAVDCSGLGVTPTTLPTLPGRGFDGIVGRIRQGENVAFGQISTSGEDHVFDLARMPDGDIAVGGTRAVGGGPVGVVRWFDPTLSIVRSSVDVPCDRVLGVAPGDDGAVAWAGWFEGANPFNGGAQPGQTAIVGLSHPTQGTSTHVFGGLGQDRATAITRLVDGSFAVCGYVHEGTTQGGAIGGFSPFCVFGYDTPNQTLLDTPLFTPLRADPVIARYVLR